MNEYNLRQLKVMKEKIRLYKNNLISLIVLVNDVRSLLDVLQINNDTDTAWVNLLHSHWFDIEQIYAVIAEEVEVASDKEALKKDLFNKHRSTINLAIEMIEKIIDTKMQNV